MLNLVKNWMDEYGDSLTKAVTLLTGDEHTAQDIVQDVFVSVICSSSPFRGESKPYSYLYRIALNKISRYRKKRKYHNEFSDTVKGDHTFSPEIVNEKSDDLMHVRTSVASLSPKLQAVIVLFYFNDYSIADISACLSIPEGTVKSRLSRAKIKLETLLKKEGYPYA